MGTSFPHSSNRSGPPFAPVAPSGFTLVEILAVIAMLALLTALLLPVLFAARARGPATTCTSNLRQLHAAFLLYAGDNDGRVPPYTTYYGSRYHRDGRPDIGPIPDGSEALVRVLLPYTKSGKVWFCPADTLARTYSQAGNVNHHNTSYATTTLLNYPAPPEDGHPITMDPAVTKRVSGKTLNPSDLVLLTDNLWPCPEYSPPQTPPYSYSHAGRVNAIYFDGHVRSFRREDGCE